MDSSRQPEITGKLVNRADLARTLGVSPPTLDVWRQRGCPFVESGGKGREWTFDTAAVFAWRCDYIVREAVASYQSEEGHITKDEADRRRAVALAICAEIEADMMLRQVVSRHDAEAAQTAFCQVLKTGLANAGAKIAGRATTITSAPEIEQMVKDEMNRAFAAAQAELRVRWSLSQAAISGTGTDADDA